MLLSIIRSLVIAAIVGWFAAKVLGKDSSNPITNMCLGSIGGLFGSIVFGLLGLTSYTILGDLIVSFIGALLTVWLYEKVIR